jgi:hypothetical protein
MAEHAHGESTTLVVPLTGELLISGGAHQEKATAGVVVLLDQGERVRLANETSEPVSPLACLPPADFIPCAPQLARLVRGDTWSTRWVGLTVVPPAQDDPAGWATSLASRADWMPCPGHGYWRRGPSARSVTRPHPGRPAR